ncbi:conserved hypothetical protein [Gammaproteobacteria bacterium]
MTTISIKDNTQEITSTGKVLTYDLTEISRHFGVSAEAIPESVRAVLAQSDFRYVRPEGAARDALILAALRELDQPLEMAGVHRHARWESGWSENLEEFRRSGYDLAALVPRFVRRGEPVRMLGDFIQPLSLNFDVSYIHLLVTWLYVRWFAGTSEIHEFGCGTAQNLVPAAQLYPGRPLFGYDWAAASREIIAEMARHHGYLIQGRVFDMFHPDPAVTLAPDAGVITIGSLEQLGTQFEAFLNFLLANRPAVVVNVDTFNELYDPAHLLDELALRYDRKRGYLHGWVTRLRTLESEGRITILDLRRTYGSRFHDGHSYVVWRPNY